jgi:hypothetical protein
MLHHFEIQPFTLSLAVFVVVQQSQLFIFSDAHNTGLSLYKLYIQTGCTIINKVP